MTVKRLDPKLGWCDAEPLPCPTRLEVFVESWLLFCYDMRQLWREWRGRR